jgi:zinc protease
MDDPSSSPPHRPDALLPFTTTEHELPNGLRVIVVPTGFPNIVSIQIPVQTGSRNEIEAGKSGFAHFFEHMMFRGTRRFPPERYQQILTGAGARSNAYTTDDYTNYHTTFAKEDLETVLELEGDRFQNLAFSEEGFKTEARAVLGEYNKNSADPLNKLLEVQRDHAFSTHPYKHTTMGFLRDIEDMPRQYDYAKVFFDRWYRPEHTSLIVAGDVRPEEVLPLVERHWGGWSRGRYRVEIPPEPEPPAPAYAHVAWDTPTLPWVTVAFHGPGFSETEKDYAAVDLLLELSFGATSELYRRLVEDEQKVDQLGPFCPGNVDPFLATVAARVKRGEDAAAVREALLETLAAAREAPVAAKRLADAKANARYSLVRSLDHTEAIAATLARFVHYRRSYETLNRYYRLFDSLQPEDLQAAAGRYVRDTRLVVATLAQEPLPPAVAAPPVLAPKRSETASFQRIRVPSALPQLCFKLLFRAGSAHDPGGKEGLAALSAAMIAEAGSQFRRIDEIRQTLFPMAGSFDVQVDKEITTFTAGVHRDNWEAFADVALPLLTAPGFREEDFRRLKDAQLNALTVDLRSNNEEELGKERLQATLFRGTPYGHPVLGTVAGIGSVSLEDVKAFVARAYTAANLTLGLSGAGAEEALPRLERELAALPSGPALAPPQGVVPRRPRGREVEIVEKDTRATALSLGHPLDITRSHPDFAALWVARTWLGEHRSSLSRLYQRIREVRGLSYGAYAYIEAFPRGMFQFFPDANVARRAQLFEIWIRPVMPQNAVMALRIALHELRQLIEVGLEAEAFEATRNYLLKNVFLMTATQDAQLGYALDSDWYGIGEFTAHMRERLAALRREDVNAAVRRHLSAEDLSIVAVARDGAGLREALLSGAFAPLQYDGEKPAELLAEDRRIGAEALGLRPDAVRITPLEEVFGDSEAR